jgi:hypothetical protein
VLLLSKQGHQKFESLCGQVVGAPPFVPCGEGSLQCAVLTGPYDENFDIFTLEPRLLLVASTEATAMAPTAVATSARNGPSLPELPAALTAMTPFLMAFLITSWYMLYRRRKRKGFQGTCMAVCGISWVAAWPDGRRLCLAGTLAGGTLGFFAFNGQWLLLHQFGSCLRALFVMCTCVDQLRAASQDTAVACCTLTVSA